MKTHSDPTRYFSSDHRRWYGEGESVTDSEDAGGGGWTFGKPLLQRQQPLEVRVVLQWQREQSRRKHTGWRLFHDEPERPSSKHFKLFSLNDLGVWWPGQVRVHLPSRQNRRWWKISTTKSVKTSWSRGIRNCWRGRDNSRWAPSVLTQTFTNRSPTQYLLLPHKAVEDKWCKVW